MRKGSSFLIGMYRAISLMVLIILYWLDYSITWLARWFKPLNFLSNLIKKIIKVLDPSTLPASISRRALIRLALKSMNQKRARTKITIGGMTIGIAAIVFLVSIGYGLQDLVIKRVARLDEMRQADVSVSPGSNLRINDKTLGDLRRMNSVKVVAPMIALVAKASYKNSSTDLVAFGVTRDYLDQSAIQPVQGEIFKSNDVASSVSAANEESDPYDSEIQEQDSLSVSATVEKEVVVTIESGTWLRVREQSDQHSQLLGYTRSVGSDIEAKLVTGKEYVDEEEIKDTWVEASFPIWEKFDEDYSPLNNDQGQQVSRTGYVAQINLSIKDSSDDLAPVETSQANDDSIATRQIDLTQGNRQVVVNRATLKVLGMDEEEAVGKTFQLSFVATKDLLSNANDRLQSNPLDYTIIGVTPDEKSPVLYVPFVDLREMGLVNFSQAKITVNDQQSLEKVRQSVEALGYETSSVADTVSQINSLFNTARTMLAMLGMVALAVASLGMFNTLTVSLLERTHEVGLMKAMGMKSSEIQDLFLAESVIMGSLGGIFGLIVGFVAAKLLELLVSIYAITMGVGFISIVSVPFEFALLIIVLSLMVGLLTGIFPARRSKRISALNALRYE